VSDRCSSYISLPEIIYILQYCQSGKTIHYSSCAIIVKILEEAKEAGFLARDRYSTQFVLLANFSLWFMLLLVHKVATYIT